MDSINGVLCILISTVKIGFSSVISASGLPIFFSTHPLGTSQFSYRYASLRLKVQQGGGACGPCQQAGAPVETRVSSHFG